MSGYPKIMSKKGLLELRDPAKRDHTTLRWGQAVVIKFFGPHKSLPSGAYPVMPWCGSEFERFRTNLFFAHDALAEQMINQLISDYQL